MKARGVTAVVVGSGALLGVWGMQSERAKSGSSGLTMGTTGPAARTTHAAMHFVETDNDAAHTCGLLLGGSDPADPLIACERSEVSPEGFGDSITSERLAGIGGQFVHGTVSEFVGAHDPKRAGFRPTS